MVVLVVLIARHKRALKIFGEQGAHLLDKSRMPPIISGRTTLLPCTFNPDSAGRVTFEKFIAQGGTYEPVADAPLINGVVVLCEEPLNYLLSGARNAVFSAMVPAIPYLENVQNFLIGNFSRLLGNYGHLVELVGDATKCQAASLPIRNFEAQELRALVEVCWRRALQNNFRNEVIPCLNNLLQRRGPKRRSRYPDVYFRDDSLWYFKYGHERHSRYETGGAHTSICLINGRFRFGFALDQERHFNVTIGDSDSKERITCQLPNCHDELVYSRDRSHINMFSNDFHA